MVNLGLLDEYKVKPAVPPFPIAVLPPPVVQKDSVDPELHIILRAQTVLLKVAVGPPK